MEGRNKKSTMNIIEIANECISDMKHKYCGPQPQGPAKYYRGTTYIAILEDNQILDSAKSSILNRAAQCIIIHHWVEKIRNEYDRFDIEFISRDGEVRNNRIDDDFLLNVVWINSWSNLNLRLSSNAYQVYCEFPLKSMPVVTGIKKIWHLYTRLKEVKTMEERMLLAKMYQQDEKILQQEKEIEGFKFANALLEKERDMYKGLLDDIKKLLLNEK